MRRVRRCVRGQKKSRRDPTPGQASWVARRGRRGFLVHDTGWSVSCRNATQDNTTQPGSGKRREQRAASSAGGRLHIHARPRSPRRKLRKMREREEGKPAGSKGALLLYMSRVQ